MSTTLESECEFAVVLLAQDGTIVDAHPSCKAALGWDRDELHGKDIGELLQSDRELLMSELLQSQDAEFGLDGQISFSIRILALRRDHTSFPARVVVRRFDQKGCCTAAFHRVNPQNDSDTPPIVRPEEIELAMRGNTENPRAKTSPAAAPAKAERPKSRWRNSRLLFGSKAQPEPPAEAPPVASKPEAPVPHYILRKEPIVAKEVPPPAEPPPTVNETPTPEPVQPEEIQIPNMFVRNKPETVEPERAPLLEERATFANNPDESAPSYDTLLKEIEQERAERRRFEARAASLSTQVGALHLEMSQHLDVETRNQQKISTLEDQIREARSQLTQTKSELAAEKQKTEVALEQVEAATDLTARLTEQLESFKLVHEALARTQSESENQLEAVRKELKESQEALSAESNKRHKLELALTAAQQDRSEQERKFKLDMCKLESSVKAKELQLKEIEVQQAQQAFQAKS